MALELETPGKHPCGAQEEVKGRRQERFGRKRATADDILDMIGWQRIERIVDSGNAQK